MLVSVFIRLNEHLPVVVGQEVLHLRWIIVDANDRSEAVQVGIYTEFLALLVHQLYPHSVGDQRFKFKLIIQENLALDD